MKNRAKKIIAVMLIAVTVIGAAGFTMEPSYAAVSNKTKVVAPSGKKDNTDYKNITSALKKYKTVKLKKGKKYYLSSPILLRSDRKIVATGATIVAKKGIMYSPLKKGGYSNLKNITVKGGTWKSSAKNGFSKTSIGVVHGTNIKFTDMVIKAPNYSGHAFEFVGCQNVTVDNVKIQPVAANKGANQETMIQIDIAVDATYPAFKGTKFGDGTTCKNVVIRNSTIRGNRGIATGYSYKDDKYINKVHTGVTLENNTITAYGGEGVFLVGAKDAVVRNNTIVSNYTASTSDKATGLHILGVGNEPNTKFTVTGNTVKGYKYGIRAYSRTSTPLNTVIITGNKTYCKAGEAPAIQADTKYITNLTKENNTQAKWN